MVEDLLDDFDPLVEVICFDPLDEVISTKATVEFQDLNFEVKIVTLVLPPSQSTVIISPARPMEEIVIASIRILFTWICRSPPCR